MNDGPRVLQLTGDLTDRYESGCTFWRTFGPSMELQRRGYGAWFRHKDDPETYKPEFPYLAVTRLDAVVIPRLSWRGQGPARRWVKSLHNAGLIVIGEYDDDIFTPQITARQLATTEPDKSPDQLDRDRESRILAARLCDGVTVTTARLKRVVEQYVDAPVHVVPNSVDVRWFRRTLRGVRRVIPPLTVGWAGGARYPEDLEPLAEAWHNIARRYPSVTFVVQGYIANTLVQAVPEGRCRRLPWLPLAEYPRALLNIDIGCANVADNHFNACKTPIKLFEYTMAGAVSVVSEVLYGPVAKDGEDCLVATTAAEWELALARLIEDAELRRRLWRAQRRRVSAEHSLERNVLRWIEAWSEIIDNYRAKAAPRVLLATA